MYNAKVNSLNFTTSGHSHLIYEENTEIKIFNVRRFKNAAFNNEFVHPHFFSCLENGNVNILNILEIRGAKFYNKIQT